MQAVIFTHVMIIRISCIGMEGWLVHNLTLECACTTEVAETYLTTTFDFLYINVERNKYLESIPWCRCNKGLSYTIYIRLYALIAPRYQNVLIQAHANICM